MTPKRILALVLGCLLLLPGVGLLLAGGTLLVAVAGRDADGFVSADPVQLASPAAAVTAPDLLLTLDAGAADWLTDLVDAELRLRVVFVGVGPASEVDAFLSGVAVDEVVGGGAGDEPDYRRAPGGPATAPAAEGLWSVSATGSGPQQITWPVEAGRWTAVVMNADGSGGLEVQGTVGLRAGALVPLTLLLLGSGSALALVGAGLVLAAARRRPALSADRAGASSVPLADPVRLEAHQDPGLSRWTWLVKWLLALPHLLVLTVLWPVFLVLTVVAGVAVLVTGRYPRPVFAFNVGVLRWSWRVSCYATTGGPGTDRYPPFSLAPDDRFPAALDVAYPPRLSRGLVLVKWWLLAVPHYLVLAVLLGGWSAAGADGWGLAPFSGGLLGLLAVVGSVVLLVTGRYPPGLYDLVIGLHRWVYRVVAYAALMTDVYPPFRLDQGGPAQESGDPASPPRDAPRDDHPLVPVGSGLA